MRYWKGILTWALLLGLTSLGSAGTVTWKGSSGGKWGTTKNWSSLVWPTSDAVINSGSATITTETALCASLTLGNGAGTNGALTMSGGSLGSVLLVNFPTVVVGNAGTGVFNQSGGTATVSTVSLGVGATGNGTYNLIDGSLIDLSSLNVGVAGQGTVSQKGGSVTATTVTLGDRAGSNGSYSLSDGNLGSLINFPTLVVGNAGTGVFNQSGGTATVGTISLGVAATGNGTYNLSGGSLVDLSSLYVGVKGTGVFQHTGGTNTELGTLVLGSNASGNGSYTLSGPSSNAVSATFAIIGDAGTGSFTQTGGTATFPTLTLANEAGSTGTYKLIDGSLVDLTSLNVGVKGTGVFEQTGGTATVTTLTLASEAGSRGTYTLNDGTLNVAFLNAGSGAATFNFGGGTLASTVGLVTRVPMNLTGVGGNATVDAQGLAIVLWGDISGTGGLTKTGEGTLQLGGSGTNTYSGGTVVQNGTLQLDSHTALGVGGLTVNGGLVELNGMNTTVAYLAGSGGKIDDLLGFPSGTTTLTVNQNSDTSYAGTIQNSRGDDLALRRWVALTKAGSGQLTLTGNNTYTGGTNVQAGTLVVSGSILGPTTVSGGTLVVNGSAQGFVDVKAGGALSGAGTIGGAHIESGGKLAPGNSPATLTVAGNLTLDPGAILEFELGSTTNSDKIAMTSGTLFLSSLAGEFVDLSEFHFSLLDGFGVGVYTLIDAAAISGSLGTDVVTTLNGLRAVLSISGNDLILTTSEIAQPPIAVPEPATFALLGLGGLAVLGLRRRRQ